MISIHSVQSVCIELWLQLGIGRCILLLISDATPVRLSSCCYSWLYYVRYAFLLVDVRG